MKKVISGLALMMMGSAMMNPLFKYQTVTTPLFLQRSEYNLPKWKIGKHYIYAKNVKDALKYAKKRGMWDGVSQPVKVM